MRNQQQRYRVVDGNPFYIAVLSLPFYRAATRPVHQPEPRICRKARIVVGATALRAFLHIRGSSICDAAGLLYMNARYYDPQLGQFISPDTLVPDATSLMDFNRYAYARGNPMKYNDPTGHCPGGVVNPNRFMWSPCESVGPATRVEAELATADENAAALTQAETVTAPEAPAPSTPLENAVRANDGAVAPDAPPAAEIGESGTVGQNTTPINLSSPSSPSNPWKFNPKVDLDWRGTGKNATDALNEAFTRTGVPKDQFEITKWGKDANGKSWPVEWRVQSGANKGAEVNVDWSHSEAGPEVPHVGYQTPGKRLSGGAVRGHILLDDVPYNR